jgi:hypothetical protein
MFIPQMAERDVHDSLGYEVDDVNTLVEYIDQEIMGHHDNTPEDEDDDSGTPYHIVKMVTYAWHPYVAEPATKVTCTPAPAKVFTGYIEHKPTRGFHDILIPPPKTA